MNEFQLVSLISLLGFLVLMLGGYRAHQVNRRRTFYMAGAWAGIFAIVVLTIDLMR